MKALEPAVKNEYGGRATERPVVLGLNDNNNRFNINANNDNNNRPARGMTSNDNR